MIKIKSHLLFERNLQSNYQKPDFWNSLTKERQQFLLTSNSWGNREEKSKKVIKEKTQLSPDVHERTISRKIQNTKNMILTQCLFNKFTLSLFLVVVVFYLFAKIENWENDTKNCLRIMSTSSWKIFIYLISSYLFDKCLCSKFLIISK